VQEARNRFARIGADRIARLVRQDYSLAEARCPRRLPIARLMGEAIRELA